MNQQVIDKFKSLFEEQRKNLLYTQSIINEDFQFKTDDLIDEVDMSSCELETSMRMRLRNRETLFLKKIDEALSRIEMGTFGVCTDCGDSIEFKRLEARPTATHCVTCKEEQERVESVHADGRKSKSMGQLRLA